MFEAIYQHVVLFGVLFIAGILIGIFGAIVAVSVYVFIMIHVRLYEWIKHIVLEVYNGIISANA